MAILIEGEVWHTMVLPIGGNHLTSDIAHGLRLPFSQAEEIKIKYGHCLPNEIEPGDTFAVKAFGEEQNLQINRREMAEILEARAEEIFSLLLQEIKRSGYDGLLPAGLVLTGGSSALRGLPDLASRVLNMPVRAGKPEKLTGMVDKLQSPAYSTSVGLLRWAVLMTEVTPQQQSQNGHTPASFNWPKIKEIARRFLP
jgi:cell division protein FtsA